MLDSLLFENPNNYIDEKLFWVKGSGEKLRNKLRKFLRGGMESIGRHRGGNLTHILNNMKTLSVAAILGKLVFGLGCAS